MTGTGQFSRHRRRARRPAFHGTILLAGFLVSALLLAFDLSLPRGLAAGIPYVLLVLLGLWSSHPSVTLIAALTATLLALLGFVLSPPGEELGKVLTNRMLTVLAIWATAVLCLLQKRQTMERARLIAQHEYAQDANRCKSEFLANMSHEIRTPMTAVLGYADILLENLSRPEDLAAVETIKRNGEHLLRLINRILDLSKIEAGKLTVERTRCSPCRIVADVFSLMRLRAGEKGLTLQLAYDGAIPEMIYTDPTRLRQVLINLVGNAVKFSETGTVRIEARLLERQLEDPELQFQVIDTGIGMTEEQMVELFQPFVQADRSTTRRFGGTGLGLTISKRLTEALGGTLRVSSALGEGSTFIMTIPTGPLDGVRLLEGPSETEFRARPANAPTPSKIRLPDCRLLLAEDGLDNQRLITLVLEQAGASVTVAADGQTAVTLALAARDEGNPFDAILMDMQMPVLDGYAAARELRAEGCTSPIIALTAHAMKEDRQKCLGAGCDEYVTKPIDRQRLLAVVAEHVPAGATTAPNRG